MPPACVQKKAALACRASSFHMCETFGHLMTGVARQPPSSTTPDTSHNRSCAGSPWDDSQCLQSLHTSIYLGRRAVACTADCCGTELYPSRHVFGRKGLQLCARRLHVYPTVKLADLTGMQTLEQSSNLRSLLMKDAPIHLMDYRIYRQSQSR